MMNLKLSFGESMVRASAFYMAIVYMIRGLLLQRRLQHAHNGNTREAR